MIYLSLVCVYIRVSVELHRISVILEHLISSALLKTTKFVKIELVGGKFVILEHLIPSALLKDYQVRENLTCRREVRDFGFLDAICTLKDYQGRGKCCRVFVMCCSVCCLVFVVLDLFSSS